MCTCACLSQQRAAVAVGCKGLSAPWMHVGCLACTSVHLQHVLCVCVHANMPATASFPLTIGLYAGQTLKISWWVRIARSCCACNASPPSHAHARLRTRVRAVACASRTSLPKQPPLPALGFAVYISERVHLEDLATVQAIAVRGRQAASSSSTCRRVCHEATSLCMANGKWQMQHRTPNPCPCVQALLHIPGACARAEEEIVAESLDEEGLFADRHFGPSPTSL